MARDMIGEPLSDVRRKLWEAFGLLTAAQQEATRAGHRATGQRIHEALNMLGETIESGVVLAIIAHDEETPVR